MSIMPENKASDVYSNTPLSRIGVVEDKVMELIKKEYYRLNESVELDNWMLSIYYEKNAYTILSDRMIEDIYGSIFADETITSFVLSLTLYINQSIESKEISFIIDGFCSGYNSLKIGLNADTKTWKKVNEEATPVVPTYISTSLDYSEIDIHSLLRENKILLTVLLINKLLDKCSLFKEENTQ